ncbi:hypothetical protein [Verrucomicrobium sp. BvORR106]|uniref:hypothetical protein n=1 Tax=Verrucomicrobium sp. BvORR106 TaxID=1403819 RepID=UPI00056F82FB|nr:hypothetical protein [Verrucomicrobium sp. BvORR106]
MKTLRRIGLLVTSWVLLHAAGFSTASGQVIIVNNPPPVPMGDFDGIQAKFRAKQIQEGARKGADDLWALTDYLLQHGNAHIMLRMSKTPTSYLALARWRDLAGDTGSGESIRVELGKRHGSDKTPATQIRLALARAVMGDENSAAPVFREWLKDHPTDYLVTLQLVEVLMKQEHGLMEAKECLSGMPGEIWREAVPDWVQALSIYGDLEAATGLARLAAAWLKSDPPHLSMSWTIPVLDDMVKQRWEQSRGYPSLLKLPDGRPASEVEPGHEPLPELSLARELAYEELREAMRDCPVTASHVIPIYARESYLAGRDTMIWAQEALVALKTLRNQPEFAESRFYLLMDGPWEDYGSGNYQCPNAGELIIHSAFKLGRKEWFEREALPVLKPLYSSYGPLLEARSNLYFCERGEFISCATTYHELRTRNTSPRQELTLQHLQPILEVVRQRGFGAEEDQLVKAALHWEMGRDRNFETSRLEEHALKLEAKRGRDAVKTFMNDLVAAAAAHRESLDPAKEVLDRLAGHEELYFPLLEACYEQGHGGKPAVDAAIERIRSNPDVRANPAGLLARSSFLKPAADLQPFLKRDQSISVLAYLGILIRDSPRAKEVTKELVDRLGNSSPFGLRLLLASIDQAYADPVKYLYPAAEEFAALPVEKRRALWPAMSRAFPLLEKDGQGPRPAIFDELKAERRAAFVKTLEEAPDLQSLPMSREAFERQLMRVLRELAPSEPERAQRLFVKGVALATAYQQDHGWWHSTGDGWTLPCAMLEELASISRNDARSLGGNEFRALVLDLATPKEQRTYFLKSEPYSLRWHRGLEMAFLDAGGAGDVRKGLRGMVQMLKHPHASATAMVAAPAFRELFVRSFAPWQISAMKQEAKALAQEDAALRPVCEMLLTEAVLAELDHYQPWGAAPDDRRMAEIRGAWAQAAHWLDAEEINPMLRLSYACHRARSDGRFLNPGAVLGGMKLLNQALQQEWPVSGNSLAPLVHAFLRLPRNEAWQAVEVTFRAAWLERLKLDRKRDSSRDGGFWPQEMMLSASVAVFAAAKDTAGLKRIWELEGNSRQHPGTFGQELARAGLFEEALHYVRPAVNQEDMPYSAAWPLDETDAETMRKIDDLTSVSEADRFALKCMLVRLRNPVFGVGRAVPVPLWNERSGRLARDFINLKDADRGWLRHCLWSADAVQALAAWMQVQKQPDEWATGLWEGRASWQGPALDRMYAPICLALNAALEGDATPWDRTMEDLRNAWGKDESRGAKVYREAGQAACWTSMNHVLGKDPGEIRRVQPVLRGYVKSLPYPTGSGIEGCCLTLQLALSALLDESDEVMNAVWSAMPARKQETFQGMDLSLAWPNALAASSTAKGPSDEKRPLEVRLRIVTKLAAHPALRGHLRRTPNALRQLISVGVLTPEEVRTHAGELAACAPCASWLRELASVLDETGAAETAVAILKEGASNCPAADDPWVALTLGAYAAERGQWNAALELANQVVPAAPDLTAEDLDNRRIEAGRQALMDRIRNSSR